MCAGVGALANVEHIADRTKRAVIRGKRPFWGTLARVVLTLWLLDRILGMILPGDETITVGEVEEV
jgi:hypothetical protein